MTDGSSVLMGQMVWRVTCEARVTVTRVWSRYPACGSKPQLRRHSGSMPATTSQNALVRRVMPSEFAGEPMTTVSSAIGSVLWLFRPVSAVYGSDISQPKSLQAALTGRRGPNLAFRTPPGLTIIRCDCPANLRADPIRDLYTLTF